MHTRDESSQITPIKKFSENLRTKIRLFVSLKKKKKKGDRDVQHLVKMTDNFIRRSLLLVYVKSQKHFLITSLNIMRLKWKISTERMSPS